MCLIRGTKFNQAWWVAHALNPSTWETRGKGILWEASQGCTVSPDQPRLHTEMLPQTNKQQGMGTKASEQIHPENQGLSYKAIVPKTSAASSSYSGYTPCQPVVRSRILKLSESPHTAISVTMHLCPSYFQAPSSFEMKRQCCSEATLLSVKGGDCHRFSTSLEPSIIQPFIKAQGPHHFRSAFCLSSCLCQRLRTRHSHFSLPGAGILSALLTLSTPLVFLSLTSWPLVTINNLSSSLNSGLSRHQAHIWYTYIHVGKTHLK